MLYLLNTIYSIFEKGENKNALGKNIRKTFGEKLDNL